VVSNPEIDIDELKKYGASLKYSDIKLEDPATLKTLQSLKKFFTSSPEGLEQRNFVGTFGDSIRSTVVPIYVYNLSSGGDLKSKYKGYEQVILQDMYALLANLVDNEGVTEKDFSIENKQKIEATVAGKWFFNKLMKNGELVLPSNLSRVMKKSPNLEKSLIEIQTKSKNIDKNDTAGMNNIFLEIGAVLYSSMRKDYQNYLDLPKRYPWK
jgi:hypothetical protein